MTTFVVDLLDLMIVPFREWNNVIVIIPLAFMVVSACFGIIYRLMKK